MSRGSVSHCSRHPQMNKGTDSPEIRSPQHRLKAVSRLPFLLLFLMFVMSSLQVAMPLAASPEDIEEESDGDRDGDMDEDAEDPEESDSNFENTEATDEEIADPEEDEAPDPEEEPQVFPEIDPDDVEEDPGPFPDAETHDEALMEKSDRALERGALDEVLALWKGVSGRVAAKMEVYEQLARSYLQRENYLKALEVLILQQELQNDPESRGTVLSDPALTRAIETDILMIIRSKMATDDLETVVSTYTPRFPADIALLRLIALSEAKDDDYEVSQRIKRFLDVFSRHPEAATMATRARQMREKMKSTKYLIGVLLPMRGVMAPFGQVARNGIQLAIEQFRQAHPQMSIREVVRELGDESEPLSEWLKTYRPLAIVGPLLSKEVNQVTPSIEKTETLLITPGATAPQISALGTSVIRNAMSTRTQCRMLAEWAARRPWKRFAILHPEGPTGASWMRCFSSALSAQGGAVVASASYPSSETDFKGPIQQLQKMIQSKPPLASERLTLQVDAIFLPAPLKEAGLILPQLAFHELRSLPILGLNDWNDPQLLKMAGRHAEGVVFIDSFFLDSLDPAVQTFAEAYKKRFGHSAHLLSAQAYDATQWILSAIEKGALTPRDVKQAISKMGASRGASGRVSEIQSGEAIKTPFVISVKKGKFTQIE